MKRLVIIFAIFLISNAEAHMDGKTSATIFMQIAEDAKGSQFHE